MKKEKSLIKEFAIQLVRFAAISALTFFGMEVAERIWLNAKSAKKKHANEKTTEAVRNCLFYPWENE